MTEYGKYTHEKPSLLASEQKEIEEKKIARKKLLDEVFHRRAVNHHRFLEKKRRLQADNDLPTHR